MTITMTITGTPQLEARLTEAIAKAPALLAEGLYTQANLIMTEAKKRTPVGGGEYSPYDKHPGTLRASGHVQAPLIYGTGVSVALGFGGAAQAYAHRQHEETGWRHVVGQAKYLESAMMEAAPGLGNKLGAMLSGKLF